MKSAIPEIKKSKLSETKTKDLFQNQISFRIASRIFSEMATPSEDHFERVNSSQILIYVYFCCEKPSDLILFFFKVLIPTTNV